MNPSLENRNSLFASYDYAYDKDQTVLLTQERKNQKFENPSTRISGVASACFSLIKALTCCCVSEVQVRPQYNIIVTQFGMISEILREPDLYWFNSIGLETQEVYMGEWTYAIKDLFVNDGNGFPYYLSATYNYQVKDPLAVTYEVKKFHTFIEQQAKIALQKVFAEQPYEKIGDNRIQRKIKKLLEKFISSINVEVKSVRITSVKVDEKMQKLLLAKQEAIAYINGRKTIVKGVGSILESTLQNLQKQEIQLTQQEINSLAVDLTYMISQSSDVSLQFLQGHPTLDQMIGSVITTHKENL
jgi:regulator of protease activity HflC (stomatin/prohibitin superfamily)